MPQDIELAKNLSAEGYGAVADKFFNAFAKSYDKSINNMFGNLHGNGNSYNHNDYDRIGFSSVRASQDFCNDMISLGINDVTGTAFKYNEQYLAEIPKTVDLSHLSSEQVSTFGLPDGTDLTSVSSVTLVECWERNTGYDAYTANQTEYIRDSEENHNREVKKQLSNSYNLVTGQLEMAGTVINKAVETYKEFQKYDYNRINDSIFQDKNGNIQSGLAQTATVINGDTVLINGQIIDQNDSRYKEAIDAYSHRMQTADSIVNGTYSGGNGFHSFDANLAMANAQQVKATAYCQEVAVSGNFNENMIGNGERMSGVGMGTLKNELDNLNSGLAVHNFTVKTQGSTGPVNEVQYFSDSERAATQELLKVSAVSDFTKDQRTYLHNIVGSDNTGITSTYGQRDGIGDNINRATHKYATQLDSGTVDTLNKMGSRVNLNTGDMIIAGASDTVTALASLGFSFNAGVALTYDDLFNVNSKIFDVLAQNGINVFNKNGIFDAKLAAKVDFSKIGMNDNVKRLFLKMNASEFGKGTFGVLANKGMSMTSLFSSGLGKIDSDNATQEFIGSANQTINAGKYAVKTVQNTAKFTKVHADRLKIRLEKTKFGQKIGLNKAKKVSDTKVAFDAERNARNVASHTKRLAKNAKKGQFVEKMRAKAPITSRIREAFFKTINIGSKGAAIGAGAGATAGAGAAAGASAGAGAAGAAGGTAAAPVIGIILLVILCLFALLAFGIVIVLVIQAFANLDEQFIYNALAPATEQETIAYVLYEKLEEEEEIWTKELATDMAVGVFNDPQNFRYTAEYLTFDELMEVDELTKTSKIVRGLKYHKGEFAINPFGEMATELLNEDAWTKLHGIDGKLTSSISANANYYSRQLMATEEGETGKTGRFTSIESGHTSNIKDIIAMTDILYQMEIAEAFDGDENSGLQSVMGKSPAQINYQHIYSQISAGLKWIGSKISSIFGKGDAPTVSFWTAVKGTGTVSYGTIENYAVNLFTASHQEMIFLDIGFFNNIVDPRTSEEIANDQPVLTDNIVGSMLDVCNSPYETEFELYWFEKPTPCIVSAYGFKYLLDNEDFKESCQSQILVTLEQMVKPNEACLWLPKPEEEYYYPFGNKEKQREINNVLSRLNGAMGENDEPCWEYHKCEEENVKIAKAYEGTSATGWHWLGDDDGAEAMETDKKAIMEEFDEERKKWTVDYWWMMNQHIPYLEIEQKDNGTNNIRGDLVSISPDETLFKKALLRNILVPEDGVQWQWVEEERESGQHYGDCPEGCTYEHKEYRYVLKGKDEGPIVLLEERDDTWERKCQGHKFKYCGGHIFLHTQGITFSVTNEQIAMTGVLDDEFNTVAENFDLKAKGFDDIRGKYDKVNYTTALTASQTGACLPVADDKAQGSDTAQSGLNLLLDGDNWTSGLEWKKLLEDTPEGEETEEEENVDADDTATLPADTFKRARDIFDIDCMLLKGNNVLPIRLNETEDGKVTGFSEFESWTADNMTLVTARVPVDWTDIYKFDIPYEINQVTINEEDRKLILDALTDRYGSKFTDARREAVELTLSWVGRGHYNEKHDIHDFLMVNCYGREIALHGNCTAGASQDIVAYIYRKTKNCNDVVNFNSMSGSGVSTGFTNCLPADIIVYQTEINESDKQYCLENPDDVSKNGIEMMMRYSEPMYAIYIGNLNETITLSSGQILQAGCPITVSLENINGIGNIWLTGRHSVSNIYDEISFATVMGADGSNRNGTGLANNYWWVENDETKAKRISFE